METKSKVHVKEEAKVGNREYVECGHCELVSEWVHIRLIQIFAVCDDIHLFNQIILQNKSLG